MVTHITYKYKILTFSSNFVTQIYVSILNTIFCKGPCNPNHGQFLFLLSNKVDTGITSHHLLCHTFLNLQLLNHKIETTKSTVHLLLFFYHSLMCGVSQSQTDFQCNIEGVYISNPQLLIDHSTEVNQIWIFSFTGTEICYLFYYHIDFWGFPEPNRDFQCDTEGAICL